MIEPVIYIRKHKLAGTKYLRCDSEGNASNAYSYFSAQTWKDILDGIATVEIWGDPEHQPEQEKPVMWVRIDDNQVSLSNESGNKIVQIGRGVNPDGTVEVIEQYAGFKVHIWEPGPED